MASILALSSGALVTSCDDDDDYDTNQFKGGVSLTAASLQVTRGAYMTFKGTGLDQITSVQFPGGVSSKPEVVDQYTIKALVPEEAEIGTVKLIYSDGELETKQIAFTEPITFDDFKADADPVLAGQNVTVTGTYLTYIEFVQFATGENVPVNNDSRTTLKVQVPLDASTGKFNLGYYSVDGTDTTEVLLESKTELNVVVPTEVKVTNPDAKAGQKLNIAGKNLQLVQYVNLPGVDPIDVTNPAVKDKFAALNAIDVTLPAEAQAGDVTLTLYSGLNVSAGGISPLMPKAAIKDAKDSYAVGDVVVISGTDLDLVTGITLNSDVDTTYAPVFKDGDINLTVGGAAKSGDITLALANGVTIPVSGFVTTKPELKDFPAAATPLDKLYIESTLASRIVKFTFGDVDAESSVTSDGKVNVQVPLEAKSGLLTYTMDNGEVVTVNENFTVNTYSFCAVYEFAAEQTIIGELLKCTVKNPSALTSIKLNGEPTTYVLNGSTLFVNVGSTVGKQRMTLVSGEGADAVEVEYIVKVQGAGLVENLVYTDPISVTGWGGAMLPVAFPLDEMPEGFKIRIHIAEANSDLQVMDGYWGMSSSWGISADVKKNVGVITKATIDEAINAGVGYVDFDPFNYVHKEGETGRYFWDADGNKWWDGSMMFNADGVIISSIGWIYDYSAPTTIWSGSFSNAGWAGNQDLAWGGYDWSLVEAGQTLYFTVEKVNKGSWACISLRHGNRWGNLVDAPGQTDLADDLDATVIEFVLTQAAIDDLVANGGLVMTGDNLIITNVAIK